MNIIYCSVFEKILTFNPLNFPMMNDNKPPVPLFYLAELKRGILHELHDETIN
jgi:hypothetical protein